MCFSFNQKFWSFNDVSIIETSKLSMKETFLSELVECTTEARRVVLLPGQDRLPKVNRVQACSETCTLEWMRNSTSLDPIWPTGDQFVAGLAWLVSAGLGHLSAVIRRLPDNVSQTAALLLLLLACGSQQARLPHAVWLEARAKHVLNVFGHEPFDMYACVKKWHKWRKWWTLNDAITSLITYGDGGWQWGDASGVVGCDGAYCLHSPPFPLPLIFGCWKCIQNSAVRRVWTGPHGLYLFSFSDGLFRFGILNSLSALSHKRDGKQLSSIYFIVLFHIRHNGFIHRKHRK